MLVRNKQYQQHPSNHALVPFKRHQFPSCVSTTSMDTQKALPGYMIVTHREFHFRISCATISLMTNRLYKAYLEKQIYQRGQTENKSGVMWY